MYNYSGRTQLPRTTVFPTTSRHGRLAYLDPATLPPISDDAAIPEQDDQSLGLRPRTANLLARHGPPIPQPADRPTTSTSSIELTTSPRLLPSCGPMADTDEQASAHRIRTIYPARPESGDLPISPAVHTWPFVCAFQLTDETQTNPLATAHPEGPVHGGIVTRK